jgi:hypothetical protein
MIALPDYTVPGTPHWGLPIFKETRILFKNSSITEIGKQRIALLIAKQFAEFVSFKLIKAIKRHFLFSFHSGLAML